MKIWQFIVIFVFKTFFCFHCNLGLTVVIIILQVMCFHLLDLSYFQEARGFLKLVTCSPKIKVMDILCYKPTEDMNHLPYMTFTMAKLSFGSITNVSPLAQSTPNKAKMSPAYTSFTSSISSECNRTNRGIRTWKWVQNYKKTYYLCSIYFQDENFLKANSPAGQTEANGI